MAIDYSGAGRWAKHIHALAIIESGENPQQIGDNGCRIGILQQRPEFLDQWWIPALKQSWTQAQIMAAAHFFQHYAAVDIDLVVQAYNKGAHEVFVLNQRNPQYLARWKEAFASLNSETP